MKTRKKKRKKKKVSPKKKKKGDIIKLFDLKWTNWHMRNVKNIGWIDRDARFENGGFEYHEEIDSSLLHPFTLGALSTQFVFFFPYLIIAMSLSNDRNCNN